MHRNLQQSEIDDFVFEEKPMKKKNKLHQALIPMKFLMKLKSSVKQSKQKRVQIQKQLTEESLETKQSSGIVT